MFWDGSTVVILSVVPREGRRKPNEVHGAAARQGRVREVHEYSLGGGWSGWQRAPANACLCLLAALLARAVWLDLAGAAARVPSFLSYRLRRMFAKNWLVFGINFCN